MIGSSTLGAPPRKVRWNAKIRRKRTIGTAIVVAVVFVTLSYFAAPFRREVSILNHAVPETGHVVDHEIQGNGRMSRFALTVRYDTPMGLRQTKVNVSGASYDAAWDGAVVPFYIDATDATNTLEEAPTVWKVAGNCLIVLLVLGALCVSLLMISWPIDAQDARSREVLETFKLAELIVSEVGSSEYVTGTYLDDEGKRWKVTMLHVGRAVEVGEKLPVLYTDGAKTVRTLEGLTGVELARDRGTFAT